MANFNTIHGHTVDVSLLTGGNVIDLGCRGFEFSNQLASLGCKVFAFDADKEVFNDFNGDDKIITFNKAVATSNGIVKYAQLGECGFTNDIKEFTPNEQVEVECVDYNSLVSKEYDLLKLDIEGGEYKILSDERFKPYPKQISVEFHHHAFPGLHDEMYLKVLNHLNKWYDLAYFDKNFPLMDCLFIRR